MATGEALDRRATCNETDIYNLRRSFRRSIPETPLHQHPDAVFVCLRLFGTITAPPLATISVTRQGSECLYMRCFHLAIYPIAPAAHSLHHFSPLSLFRRNAGPNPEDHHNAVRTYTGRH